MTEIQDRESLSALQNGRLAVQGEFLWGSNYTFMVQVEHKQTRFLAVYKPTKGERPLWDFPRASLARREVAAYQVSEALGWHFVPPTVYRKDAPMGPGSLQQFIEHDPEYNYFSLSQVDRERMRKVALFDLLINNADRKGSHIIFDSDGKLWLIDHGICFHRENKLRTVIWDFAGDIIPAELCADLRRLQDSLDPGCELATKLAGNLSPEEIAAIAARASQLLSKGRFPDPHLNRRPYPWPPV